MLETHGGRRGRFEFAHTHATASNRFEPEDRPRHLGAPRSHEPGDTEYFTATKLEAHVPRQTHSCEPLDLEDNLSGRPRRPREELVDVPADHRLHDRGGARVGDSPFINGTPVAQHREAVRNLPHLFEEVRDIDDREAALFEPADESKEFFDVRPRETARRLVEDENFGLQNQRAGNLDDLPGCER